MSNSASRARSLVGRTVRPSGAVSARPRCLPAMIRMARAGRALGARRRLAGGRIDAELLAQHPARHLLDRAARQLAELERAIGQPKKPRHAQAQMLQHAADLAILALAQAHRQPGIAALLAVERG